MKRIHLVLADGRVTRGAEAIARALAALPVVGVVALLYYMPLLRCSLERLYSFVARHRYRLLGRSAPCDPDGTCHLH